MTGRLIYKITNNGQKTGMALLNLLILKPTIGSLENPYLIPENLWEYTPLQRGRAADCMVMGITTHHAALSSQLHSAPYNTIELLQVPLLYKLNVWQKIVYLNWSFWALNELKMTKWWPTFQHEKALLVKFRAHKKRIFVHNVRCKDSDGGKR